MRTMLRLMLAMVIVLSLSLPPLAMGEDSKDVLTLKRDNLILRLQLMEQQLTLSAPYQALVKEIKETDAKLKAMEAPKPKTDVPKPKEGKK